MQVPINLTGGTYETKSKVLSSQIARNFWPRRVDNPLTRSGYILDSWVGLKEFATTTGNADRGMLEHLGVLYKVTETTLYSVSSAGVATSLGTIPGAGRCILEGIGSNVVIVSGGRAFVYNGSSIAEIVDGDLETPNGAAHLNNQMLFDGDGGRFVSSAVGDATDIPALNYATAESNADNLKRVYAYDQLAYMLGDKTIEPWVNSGVGLPPFDRLEGGIIPIGLGAVYAVAHNDNFLYIFDSNREVHAIKGSAKQKVSDSALNKVFQSYSTVSDAICWTMRLEGQNFLVLTFPVEEKTWVYVEGGEWFEWTYGVNAKRSLANSYAYAHGKHLVGDYSSGKIYELDFDTYTNAGNTIIRQRDTAPIHSGLFGQPGKRIELNKLEIFCEPGIGLLTGQGSNPKIMVSISYDGGFTFGTEMQGSMAKLSDKVWKIVFNSLGSFEVGIIRVKVSDPVYTVIFDAVAEIEIGI